MVGGFSCFSVSYLRLPEGEPQTSLLSTQMSSSACWIMSVVCSSESFAGSSLMA